MMNLPAEGKPQIQLICDRLIDRFAARLKEDSSLDIPLDTQEEFLRIWREGTAERLRNQSSLFPQKEGGVFGLQSDSSPREEIDDSKKGRINPGESDDEFEDANWDTLGFETSLGDNRLRVCAEEIKYKEEIKKKEKEKEIDNSMQQNPFSPAAPPLDDLTQPIRSEEAADRVIGHVHKISRPADCSRALSSERSLQWSLIIRNGIIKIAGQEFAFGRLDADLKEI
ncbi:hypothetical protein, conserved [Eimeria maxima]|uniref:Uncharacterized protein n=1 Tax=Eimeria maxima TaxID=5804 RepID=U6M4S1_EIMMA|nr:hypothetical protein, conserved [Eimeria maxima]CDJ57454.1 hypothetical protein, conserved [Eimeria maxima]